MNTRRGFFARFGLAIGAVLTAPKLLLGRRQSNFYGYDARRYMGEVKWRIETLPCPWLNMLQAKKFPSDLGLTKSVVSSKV